jgi:2-succinyl-5-enolpyruvyl-6-hydroxy-3-cyclohexene-1-carboxylate synthase
VSFARAADLVAALARAGVATWCVCPGGRNAPLVIVLQRAHGITSLSFHDERSAAFFALGRARATGAPVAVVTTSGTAAAELLPAAVEAYYSGIPLVLVTADRPPRFRGTGSPQAIEQVGRPVHVNICFDEPLADGEPPVLDLAPAPAARRAPAADPAALVGTLGAARRPLVLLGPLDAADHAGVCDFVVRLGAPAFVEAASGLREHAALAHLRITSGERALRAAGFDAVLRIGGVPTLRLWRDLEARLPDVAVCSVDRTPFPGLTRGRHITAEPGALLGAATPAPLADTAWRDGLLARDRARQAQLDGLWPAHPRAEPAMVRGVSALVPVGSLVYLGNSLPIREWDLAALRNAGAWTVGVSRGANGIDGQLSTFFGMCAPGREHWALVGDLTALYDLGAPWILRRLASGPIRIVVVMWDLAYQRWDTAPSGAALPDRVVIELAPETAATDAFWRAYDALD